MQWRDSVTKLIYFLFLFSIALLICYQVSLVLLASAPAPFLEPDNYEYYLFASLAIQQHSFNVTNPFLVHPSSGFFEAPMLLWLPVVIHIVLNFVPLFWSFRVAYLFPILIIYLIPLLIVRKVLQSALIAPRYRYLAYTLVILNFTLMQQTEIIEWRGNTFITAIQVLILYLMAMAFTVDNRKQKYGFLGCSGLLLTASILFWREWFLIAISSSVLLLAFILYSKLSSIQKYSLYKYGCVALIIFVASFLFLEHPMAKIINDMYAFFGYNGCLNNPLQLAEVQCLTLSTGLLAILLYFFFGVFAVTTFLYNKTLGLSKHKYEYFIVGSIVLLVLEIPLALAYLRMVQTIAPYLSLSFSLGIVGLFVYFSRLGSNRLVLSLVVLEVVFASTASFIVFGQSTILLYHFANPAGLSNATAYLNNFPNTTVFAYFGFGGMLESYGNVKTYGDTIQQLGSINLYYNSIFNMNASQACIALRNITPIPEFVMLSPQMLFSVPFTNTSMDSLVSSPLSFDNACGYALSYANETFYIFRRQNLTLTGRGKAS